MVVQTMFHEEEMPVRALSRTKDNGTRSAATIHWETASASFRSGGLCLVCYSIIIIARPSSIRWQKSALQLVTF